MDEQLEKLRESVEKQAKNLDPAQRDFVLAEFGTYVWNANHIAELERQLEEGVIDAGGYHNYDAEGKLFRQRHQLVAEQSSLFTHIMRWLKGTVAEESALDEFLSE